MRHMWGDTELWGRKALACEACGLHIVDADLGVAWKSEGMLHLLAEGPIPEGVQLVRWQVSNVLNYGFKDRTREEIIAYAEDEFNRECSGDKSARWEPYERIVIPVTGPTRRKKAAFKGRATKR